MFNFIKKIFLTIPSSRKLNQHLIENDFYILEGHSGQNSKQQQDLNEILIESSVHEIAEIGFNGGHSSLLFLGIDKRNKVTSFDLVEHDYSLVSKAFIDNHFHNRHELISGDSKKTLIDYAVKFPERKFDLIFIDGGHDFETALADLINAEKIVKQAGVVILDDTITGQLDWVMEHNVGPNEAWLNMTKSKKIKEVAYFNYGPGRGMSMGRYQL